MEGTQFHGSPRFVRRHLVRSGSPHRASRGSAKPALMMLPHCVAGPGSLLVKRHELLRAGGSFAGKLVLQDPKDESASALFGLIATARGSRAWRAKPLKKRTMRTRCDRVGDAVPVAAREPSG